MAGDGDGVVSFTSGHLDNVASEVVLNADHLGIHRHPLAVLEVHRVLREHLAEIDAHAPQRLQRLPGTRPVDQSAGLPSPTPATAAQTAYPVLQAARPPLP